MGTRGPKLRNSKNTRGTAKGIIRHDDLVPTSILNHNAMAEFRRLVDVLSQKGTLDRIDLAIVTECARIKALLDRIHDSSQDECDSKQISAIGMITTQRRGLLRELGLTTCPSRVHVRPGSGLVGDPIASKIKLAHGSAIAELIKMSPED